jgi:hypothetical protein
MPELTRPQKITFAEMREAGARGLLIYCADYRFSHSIASSGDAWPDDYACPILSRVSSAAPVASVARLTGLQLE